MKARRDIDITMSKCSKANAKLLFNYVASQTKPREGIANLLNEKGELTSSDADKCSVFKQLFYLSLRRRGRWPNSRL